MQTITIRTERQTEFIDITQEVDRALGSLPDGAAALIYVPHTTAGITLNERIDSNLLKDLRLALEEIVAGEWSWEHSDADGMNAPSHVRASLIGSQVIVPLNGGALSLGQYQGILFCEFDGPRRRTVHVTTLR